MCRPIAYIKTSKWEVKEVPLHGNFELRPLGVDLGNAVSGTRVWRYICKNTNCWPATAHDVTTGATIIKEPPGEYIILFFVFTDWSVWSVHSGRNTVFLYYQMASTSKAFKKCVDPCPRYLTPDDTHDCCVFCLGEEHARDVLEGAICVHCERFSMKKLRSSFVPLFEERGSAVCFPRIRDPPWLRHGGEWNRGARRWIWLMS